VSEQNTSKRLWNRIKNWRKRLKRCISHDGLYFEGLR
jgi:hypothetical protein